MAPESTEYSDAQAFAALKKLANPDMAAVVEPEPGTISAVVGNGGESEQVEQVAEQAAPAPEPAPEQVGGQVEDVASLKARLEGMAKDFDSLRGKTSQSLEWSRNLALRTATERDRLKTALRGIKEKGQISAEEIDALLAQGSQPVAPALTQQSGPDETAAMEAFRFQVDNNINDDQAGVFDGWIRSQNLSQRDIVDGNPYATLSLLWSRYQRENPPGPVVTQATVQAAQSIARTQRAAARAAGPPVSRSAPAPPADKQEDLGELIRKDPDAALKSGLIDKLFRQVNEGYR